MLFAVSVETASVLGARIQEEFGPLGKSSEERNANDHSLRKQLHKDGRKSELFWQEMKRLREL